MNAARPLCTSCRSRASVSHSIARCEVCLYAEQMGREAAERQLQAAKQERRKRKRTKK